MVAGPIDRNAHIKFDLIDAMRPNEKRAKENAKSRNVNSRRRFEIISDSASSSNLCLTKTKKQFLSLLLDRRVLAMKKICVIGAGPAGLTAAKNSSEQGYECDVFEQTGLIGGLWNYTDDTETDANGLPIHTAMYRDLK